MYQRTTLEHALQALGDLLADRAQAFEVVAIGGGALAMLGLIDRPTEDIDLVAVVQDAELCKAQPLPPELQAAIADIAALHGLHGKWVNGEPTGLLRHGLPAGFLARCSRRSFGGLSVLLASRFDQIHLKLLAISRQDDKHHADLRQLQPSVAELRAAAAWARTQATGAGFEFELRGVLATFELESNDV